MAIQIRESNPRNVTPQPLLGDQPIITNLEQLKIPDEVALRPENVAPYLASQSHRLHGIEIRPDFRAMEGEIPEFVEERSMVSGLTTEEQRALHSWSQERFGTQSNDFNPNDLLRQIDQLVSSHAEQTGQQTGGQSGEPDIFGGIILNQKLNETREERAKWEAALANAKGNPENVALILGMRAQAKYVAETGRLLATYNTVVAKRERIMAQMDLAGHGQAAPSQADISRMNAQTTSVNMDVSLVMQQIQSLVSEMSVNAERTHEFTKRIDTDFRQIQNNFLAK